MDCVVCGAQLELEKGEVCSSTECIDKWLKSGHGPVSGHEYKGFMDRCLKAVQVEDEQVKLGKVVV